MASKAKLFTNGGSQAVRLPKAFRFEGREVIVESHGDAVLLRAAKTSNESLWDRIDAIRGDEQLAYSEQPVLEEMDVNW